MLKKHVLSILFFTAALSFLVSGCKIEKISSPKFNILIKEQLKNEIDSARIILILSKSPQINVRVNGDQIFGKNFENNNSGDNFYIDEDVLGYPNKSIADIPKGEYFVTAYVNKYTTFERSDGKTIQLHADNGEGQSWRRSPGNLYSETTKIDFDPEYGTTFDITIDEKIDPILPPMDSEWVKNVRIQSRLLSDFWGKPIYLGAKILLPKGYNTNPDTKYPVLYHQGHFSSRNPGSFGRDSSFTSAWKSNDFPRMMMVTFQHASPYYDDSYGVNSENMGPYGDAIIKELIPYIENNFRAIAKPYSRVLSGGSTGGWISLAMQVWNPDFFGGTWSGYPDQVDFRYYQIVNILEDANAYYTLHDWTIVERPGNRKADGNIVYTMKQENMMEEVLGDKYRSGGQWAAWNATFAPVGDDGYPKPIWDPLTGVIDKNVAQWARDNYDIRYYLENNWAEIGPKLVGKLHVYCGRMDNYHLNEAVYLLEDFLENTTDPNYGGDFRWGDKGRHGWSPFTRAEMIKEMAEAIAKNAPEGEDTDWKK